MNSEKPGARPSTAHPRRFTKRARSAPRRPSTAGTDLRRVARSLREFALTLPGTTEDFPWGERVAKVKGKVFVFLGPDPVAGSGMGLSVKLPVSREEALELPFTRPTAYGLGKSGWVSASFEPPDRPPVEILEGWILESYRAVAPRKFVAELDAARAPRSPGPSGGTSQATRNPKSE